jgi:hypothetical protein
VERAADGEGIEEHKKVCGVIVKMAKNLFLEKWIRQVSEWATDGSEPDPLMPYMSSVHHEAAAGQLCSLGKIYQSI